MLKKIFLVSCGATTLFAGNPFREEANKHLKMVPHTSGNGGFSVKLERKPKQEPNKLKHPKLG